MQAAVNERSSASTLADLNAMADIYSGSVSPQDEQLRFLQDSSNNVKRSAFYMKRALVSGTLSVAYRTALRGELTF